jgi:hypothetical protein
MECRVFKLDIGWGYALFHFPMEIDGKTVRNHSRTKHIQKENYIGTFLFDENYLKTMEYDIMDNIKYYFICYMTVTK